MAAHRIRPTEEQKAVMIEHRDDYSYIQFGKMFLVSPDTIRKWFKEMGIEKLHIYPTKFPKPKGLKPKDDFKPWGTKHRENKKRLTDEYNRLERSIHHMDSTTPEFSKAIQKLNELRPFTL